MNDTSTGAPLQRTLGWPNTLSPHDCGAAIEGVWPSLFFGRGRIAEMRRKVETLEWARIAFEQWRAEAEPVLGTAPQLPIAPIGWRHDFYSPGTAEHLLFDPDDGKRLVDPWDGTTYGPDGANSFVPEGARGRAWTLLVHERTYRLMHALAILYALTGEERYGTWVVAGLRRAVEMFRREDFRASNRHHALYLQPLYDAQILLLIATTYELTRESAAYTAGDHASIRREVFESAVPHQIAFLESTAPQNMMACVSAALVVAGDTLSRQDWARTGYDHPRSGFYALMEYALRRDAEGEVDGFWIEGTQFYHLYSVCPLLALHERWRAEGSTFKVQSSKEAGPGPEGDRLPRRLADREIEGRLVALLDAPRRMADEALRLPTFGDLGAPKQMNLRLYRHVYEYGAGLLEAERFTPILARMYAAGLPRNSLAAVAFGPDVLDLTPASVGSRASAPSGKGIKGHSGRSGNQGEKWQSASESWRTEVFRASGIVFLRGVDARAVGAEERYQVWLRSAAHGQGHDHLDKLSIGIHAAGEVVATDLGTAGYGLADFTAYCRSTFAHNTLLVDEQNQQRVKTASLRTGDAWAVGVVEDAYPGVRLERRVVLDAPYVLVEDVCRSDEAHRYAWVFHGYGSLAVRTYGVQSSKFEVQHRRAGEAPSEATEASVMPALPEDGVWRWLTNRRGGVIDRALCADWRIRDGLWLRAWVQSDGAMEWTAGQTPGNPMPDRRGTLVLRVAGLRRRFRAAFEIHHGAPHLSAFPAERFEGTPLGEERRDQ